MQASSSHQRPYQGYPYVDPPVTDAPSISAVTAARWNHLPRRQVEFNVRREAPSIPLQDGAGSSSIPKKRDSNPAPVVYIDLPEASGSDVSDRRNTDSIEDLESVGSQQDSKREPGVPVVYIDLPEASGSDVTQSQTPQEDDPEFVQETIFYDPFENRRIDRSKEHEPSNSDSESEAGWSPTRPQRATTRPDTLDLNGAGTSTSYPSSSGFSSLMSKQAEIYGRTDSDGFPASPIPRSQFPEPPPAYTEIDVSTPALDVDPIMEQPRAATPPPRTQVILPGDTIPTTPVLPIGLPNPDRKYLNCHHCNMRVHTLVIRESGTVTHTTALACLFICMLPVVAFIYCTDYLKIKNHYCPNCNKIIGYELPMCSSKIIYVN